MRQYADRVMETTYFLRVYIRGNHDQRNWGRFSCSLVTHWICLEKIL
jgi:hypothetical protein